MSRDGQLSLEQIGASAYRAFAGACAALQVKVGDDFQRGVWSRIADVLSNNDATFTVQELGNFVRSLYLSVVGAEASEDIEPSAQEKIAWQATGLHFFNLIQGTDPGEEKMLEMSWASWAREQLSPAHEDAAAV